MPEPLIHSLPSVVNGGLIGEGNDQHEACSGSFPSCQSVLPWKFFPSSDAVTDDSVPYQVVLCRLSTILVCCIRTLNVAPLDPVMSDPQSLIVLNVHSHGSFEASDFLFGLRMIRDHLQMLVVQK